MRELCEVCHERHYSKLCDHATGTGIVTSLDFQEMTVTCDKKLCIECAVTIWANCDVCPDHAKEVKTKLANWQG